jgi:hypothetical protein
MSYADLVGLGRDQLGLDLGRVGGLRTTLPNITVGAAQQPVERRFACQVDALVEQRRPDLRRCGVAEPVAVQHGKSLGAFLSGQRRRLRPVQVSDPRRPRRHRRLPVPAVVRSPGPAERRAGRDRADQPRELEHRLVSHLLDRGGELGPEFGGVVAADASCALLDRSSKRAETSPCTSITRRAVSRSASSLALRSLSRALSRSTS